MLVCYSEYNAYLLCHDDSCYLLCFPPDNSFLDWFDDSTESQHPVFGKIVEGYDLIMRISQVPTRNDNPSEPVQMIKIRVP